MSPYLTGQGKWLFVTGGLFCLLGALVREPVLILFGQIPFLVLIGALVSLLPAARSLDRRSCHFTIGASEESSGVVTLRCREETELLVWMENGSTAPLRVRELRPYTAGEIDVAFGDGELRVQAGHAGCFEIKAKSRAVGRSSLQGFDIVLADRWGLLAARDYLPCVQVFETYPKMGGSWRRRSSTRRPSTVRASQVVDRRSRAGTDLRELRDYEPGDPLKSIAWKATVRQRRLISREFDDERTQVEYIGLDISSSMRAGIPRGEKFEHSLRLAAGLCSEFLTEGRKVGLWTFDQGLYGEIDAQFGSEQRRRIQRHLVGLRSVVAPGRTSLDDDELEAALADYLLVQERLDFRRGKGLQGELDSDLLRRWLSSTVKREEQQWKSAGESYGVIDDQPGLVRRFFRLRGVPLQPPSETRSGSKIDGIESVVQTMIRRETTGGRLIIISDLCGLNDVEVLERTFSVARRRGTKIRFLVPFTPYFGDDHSDEGSSRAKLIRDLFTRAERRDRLDVARRLSAMGTPVRFIGPK